MKKFITLLIITTMCSISYGNFQKPEVFNAAPQHVFAPQGFDTNDNVEFLFDGQFTDACYRVGLTYTEVDEERKQIFITDTGHYFGDAACAEIIVPYQKEIQAGILSKGMYTVYFRNSRGNFVEAGVIPVRDADNANPDDHLYAPVKQSTFVRKSGTQAAHIVLSGQFTNTCMEIQDVKVNPRPGSNVVDILPIARMNDGNCKDVASGIDFKHKVGLPQLDPGRFLFHVRSLNGKSVNEIVTIE